MTKERGKAHSPIIAQIGRGNNPSADFLCDVFLSFYLKSFAATGTDHGVLALCLGEPQNGVALRTLAIDVGLSVTEAIAKQFEETAKLLVFLASFEHVSGKYAVEDQYDQRPGQQDVDKSQDP